MAFQDPIAIIEPDPDAHDFRAEKEMRDST
jgi:hypothetical protein